MGAAVPFIMDFGPFPGASDASVVVTGLTGIATTSRVEAYIEPAPSDDHSADEHMVETIKMHADQSSIVADTSCVVKAFNTNQLNEPLEEIKGRQSATTGVLQAAQGNQRQFAGGMGTRLYGKWNGVLVWN